MAEPNKKYLVCPCCFSIYSLDKPQEDDIIECCHCEDSEVASYEEFMYYSSLESLRELKNDFIRSGHLESDTKEFIIGNLEILIELIKEKTHVSKN